MIKELSQKIVRFLIAGGASTAFMFATLLVLHEWLNVWYLWSSTIALILTTIVSFTIQKFWAFQDRSLHSVGKQFYVFATLAVFNLFANALLMYVFVEYFHIWYLFAQIITTGFIAAWDFLLYHFVIFSKKHDVSPIVEAPIYKK